MTNKPKRSFWLLKFLVALISLGIAGSGILAIMIILTYPKLPSMDELRNYQPKLPLQVYSNDKVLLGQFGEEHRIFVSFNDTPKMLINAILAAEDERFYQHGGIDYIGVIRALGMNIVSGRKQSGASTITMQLARNFFLSSQKTYTRKFNEVLLAYKMENSLTKDQILELYINQIYLGQRAYGFGEAALTYFGRPLDKLTIAEYAVLAGLPKAPSAYNPVVNKKRSHEREMYVLGRMFANNFISEAQYNEAINQPIIIAGATTKDATNAGGYIAEMVRQMLYDKYGDKIYTDGYKVYTTVDSKMEQAAYISLRNGLLQYDKNQGYRGCEQQLNLAAMDDLTDQVIMSSFDSLTDFGDLQAAIVIDANNNSLKVKIRNGNILEFNGKDLDWIHKYLTSGGNSQLTRGCVVRVRNSEGKWSVTQLPTVEGALVAISPNDGAIKALIGGFDFTKNNYNHVTQAMRQPGSSFKPFIYSAALEKGLTSTSLIDDVPICFASGGDDGGQWCPRNDDNEFMGTISLRQALTFSRNVVTVKILNKITPAFAIDYVTKFGFNKTQFQPYLTMALGASEVTPMQMAQAFAVFANGGYLVQPYLIKTINDSHGNLLAKTDSLDIHNNQPVIDPRNAFIMNSMLQDVVRYGTGARAYKELKRDDLAGKTGTTTDAKDVWFDGYTPNLVAITWLGYDQPKSLGTHAYGASLALPIWINFMKSALPNIPEATLPMPDGITVLHNVTWRGNDDYVYTGTNIINLTGENNESGAVAVIAPEHSDSSDAINNLLDASTPSKNDIPTSTQTTPASETNQVQGSPTAATSAKPSSVDDIIQNIKD
ncbi:MAG: penicillin-binding protein 1A [Burkholderiales bacterium]|nr:penicillin-binding protein 1A [Burkholderiales bacterium]